jgi:hypothetical protein
LNLKDSGLWMESWNWPLKAKSWDWKVLRGVRIFALIIFRLLEPLRNYVTLSLVFRMLIFRSIWPMLLRLSTKHFSNFELAMVQYGSYSRQSTDQFKRWQIPRLSHGLGPFTNKCRKPCDIGQPFLGLMPRAVLAWGLAEEGQKCLKWKLWWAEPSERAHRFTIAKATLQSSAMTVTDVLVLYISICFHVTK